MGKQDGWCPFGRRLQIPVSPLRWSFPSTGPYRDSDAHVIAIAHSDAKCVALPPRPTSLVYEGPPAVVQAVHDIPKD